MRTFPRRPTLLAALAALGVLAVPPAAPAADRSFTQRFAATDTGDIAVTGNTVLTCQPGGQGNPCSGVRNGTTGGTNAQNGAFSMVRVDVDSDSSTTTSSAATVTVPTGATVLWAGLYWGGASSAATATRDQVSLRVPGASSYTQVDAAGFDTATDDADVFQGFANITTAVRAAGSGTYTVGNVQADTGTGGYGGWSIVMVYRDATAPRHNLFVYDGFRLLSNTGTTSVALPISGLTTPSSGTVDLDLGFIAYDGDRALDTDSALLGTTTLGDTLNPTTNFFNSTVTRKGTRISAKNPDHVDQLGFDADVVAANGALSPGATTGTLTLNAGNELYAVGMLSFVTESEIDPPETTLTSGPSGPTNDSTPTFAFSSDETGSTFECSVDTGAFASCTSPYTTPTLTEGPHTVEIRAIDLAGNIDPTPISRSIVVDVTPPQTTLDSGAGGPTTDATPTFTFSADQTGSTFQCHIDGGEWAACESAFTTAELTDGEHTFEVRAVDPAGNVDPTPASRTFTVDTAPPDTAIDSAPTGSTADATPDITFSGDAGSGFECRVDGGEWAACTSPFTPAELGDGPHTVDVRAVDAAGNADPSPASASFTVDTTPPETTIDAGPAAATNDATPDITFSSGETGATFECRVDGGDWAACTSPLTTDELSDGEHTVDVRATDAAGNVDATPASVTFTVDTAVPDTTITAGSTGLTVASPTFEFTSDEAGAAFECRVDDGDWAPCTSPTATEPLADGEHTFEVRAKDAAGNVDATPAGRTFTVDTTAAQTSITEGPVGPTSDSTPTFAFTADEAGSTLECRIDGGDWAACESPFTTEALEDGEHTFEVRGTDPAGNVDATPDSRAFTVDTRVPDATITSGPSGAATADATPTFELAADEEGATLECRIDGGEWAACESPFTAATLTDGEHTFEVRALDAAGNTDATPAAATFVVDTVAPQTTIDEGPSGPTSTATPTFAFSSDEPGATFECRVDDGDWTDCTSPLTMPTLIEGELTLEVRAKDAAGNLDETPAVRTIVVDTTAPDTTIETGPTGTITIPTATYELSSDEPAATFECRVDGGAWEPCASPVTTDVLDDGTHSFEARAVDPAGNVDPTPAAAEVTVDTTAPHTTISEGPSGPTASATASFRFVADESGSTYECRFDGGDWAACDSPATFEDLDEGSHRFEVRATDQAGNREGSPARRDFVVDTVAPDTTIASGPTGTTEDDTPSFELTSGDAQARFECRIDGGGWSACDARFAAGALADGAHELQVRAVDPAGNADATPASRSFTVARPKPAPVPPVVSVRAPADNAPAPTFQFTADQAGTTYLCRVDSGAFAPCGAAFTVPGNLSAGQHTLEVLGVNAAGLRSQPVQVGFQVGAGCAGTNGFRSASVRGDGRALRIRFSRLVDQPVRADVFQVAVGRNVLRERLVARFRGLTASQTWPARTDTRSRAITDGVYFVRLSIPLGSGRTDVRRLVAQRTNGRWTARAGYYSRAVCGLVSSFKLERAVFGGDQGRPARISFRVAVAARVTVDVLRGSRVVRRLGGRTYRSGSTTRLSLPARGLRTGTYRFRLTAVAGTRRAVVTAEARRL